MILRKTIILTVAIFLVNIAALTGCGTDGSKKEGSSSKPPAGQKVQYLTMGTASASGTFYLMGAAMSELFNEKIPGVKATAQPTPGYSGENIPAITDHRMELGMVTSDQAYYGYIGGREFKSAHPDIRAIMSGAQAAIQFVVREDSGIKSFADLKGKRIALGPAGSAQENSGKAALEAYGITDYKPLKLNVKEELDALGDNNVDLAIITSAPPNAQLAQMESQIKLRFLEIDEEHLKTILEKHPYWSKVVVPAGTYKGMTKGYTTFAYTTMLVCHKDLNQDVVYNIIKTITENIERLKNVHKSGAEWTVENATVAVKIPFHQGAAKYLAEKGIKVETK